MENESFSLFNSYCWSSNLINRASLFIAWRHAKFDALASFGTVTFRNGISTLHLGLMLGEHHQRDWCLKHVWQIHQIIGWWQSVMSQRSTCKYKRVHVISSVLCLQDCESKYNGLKQQMLQKVCSSMSSVSDTSGHTHSVLCLLGVEYRSLGIFSLYWKKLA